LGHFPRANAVRPYVFGQRACIEDPSLAERGGAFSFSPFAKGGSRGIGQGEEWWWARPILRTGIPAFAGMIRLRRTCGGWGMTRRRVL